MRLLRLAAALLALAVLAGCTAAAPEPAACGLRRWTVAQLIARDNLLLVPVWIDTKPSVLLLDTGAQRTILTEAAVRRLHLRTDPLHITHTAGIGGGSSDFDVWAGSFMLGPANVPIERLAVGHFHLRDLGGITPDGLLGSDILSQFDLDLDPKAGRITLYRGLPCGPARPLWRGPYDSLPEVGRYGDRITVPLAINGVTTRATLDTGAQFTAVDRGFAEQIGANFAADQRIVAHGASPGHISVPAHRFATLRVGTFSVRDPVLPVVSLPKGAGGALLGGDFLAGRRVWLSYPSARVFIATPGG